MPGTLARSYRFVLARIDDEIVDRRVVLFLAIERITDLLLARFKEQR